MGTSGSGDGANRAGTRLLFVVNHAGFFISHRLPLALAAREHGYDVHVATPRSKHVPRLIESGITWHPIRLSRSGLQPFRELVTLWDLARLYIRVAPAIVHHVTLKPVLYGTWVARLVRVPAVVNAISGMGYTFSKGGGLHAMLRRIISLAYGLTLKHRHMRVIVQNPDHLALFLARRWTMPDQARLIPGSGVDMQRFAPRRDYNREGPPQVVFASRMLYTKGVEEFVKAARILKHRGLNARFLLVGEPDPENRASVPAIVIQQWDAEGAVTYRGRSDDMPSVFADADIVCLPSYDGEGIPKVLVEAAACALPIVTTNWQGCRDVVADGVNGLLVPIKDPSALAAAIERLAGDAELRRLMGARGRERVQQSYSVESVVDQTLSIYRELLA